MNQKLNNFFSAFLHWKKNPTLELFAKSWTFLAKVQDPPNDTLSTDDPSRTVLSSNQIQRIPTLPITCPNGICKMMIGLGCEQLMGGVHIVNVLNGH